MTKGLFTQITYDDNFLPHWLKYYRPNFDECVIITKETNEESNEKTDKLAKEWNCKIERFSDLYPDLSFWSANNQTAINIYKDKYLKKHKWICFAHADEFLVPDPDKYKNLSEYIDDIDETGLEYKYATGYTVVHLYDSEPPIDWSKPLLKQRKQWYKNHSYNKPLIMCKSHEYVAGFHKFKEHHDDLVTKILPDPDLRMIHCDTIDVYQMPLRARHRVQNVEEAKKYNDLDKDKREDILERFKVF